MHLDLTEPQRAFRDEARAYFESLLTRDVRVRLHGGSRGVLTECIRDIGAHGYFSVGWPAELGGRELGPIEQFIAFDEMMRAGGPPMTTNTLAPAIRDFGTDEQKAFFLPRLLAGELSFCIGYSEPGAGTDLAGLSTRAVRDGDEYVINGQKTWTSVAQSADYVWLAVRTDPDVAKHKGISVLLVPMDTPGIKVLPIDIIGESDINQVFYEDVRVPVSARIGEENEGWTVITSALNYERVVLCSSGVIEVALTEVRRWAQRTTRADGRRVIDEEWVQLSLARLHAKLEVLRLMNLRNAWAVAHGEPETAHASATKVFGAELYQEAFVVLMEVVGEVAYLRDGAPGVLETTEQLEHAYRNHVILTFAGGTSEINRDLVAVFGLGMPRSPRS